MSAEQPRPGPDRRLLIALAVAVAILLVLTLLAIFGGDDDSRAPAEQTEPAATEPAELTETPAAVGTEPTSTPSPDRSPTDEPTEQSASGPDQSDVDAFVAAEGPAAETTTGDVTGDGVDEVVLARIRNSSTQIIVGRWNGSAYEAAFRDEGGSAESIERLEVRDYNGVPGGEIVTEQVVGEAGRSISVWGVDGPVERQDGRGGCADGFNTYGVNGASISQGRITATCDASALPGEVQPRDIYRWRRGRWTYVRSTVTAGG